MNETEIHKAYLLRNSKANLTRLATLHRTFTATIPYLGKSEYEDGQTFLGFSDDGLMCLLTTSTVVTRHIHAIKHLLLKKYPVQAMILLRSLIEAWFYILMYFEEPARAEDYLKNPVTTKGKPKYKPFEVKQIALQVIRTSPFARSPEYCADDR